MESAVVPVRYEEMELNGKDGMKVEFPGGARVFIPIERWNEKIVPLLGKEAKVPEKTEETKIEPPKAPAKKAAAKKTS